MPPIISLWMKNTGCGNILVVNSIPLMASGPSFLRQRGMTLIEVLVALVILALGLLGAGGLILASLRSSQYATSASVAMGLARDYGEIMQTIPARVISTGAAGTNVFLIDTNASMSEPTAKCTSSACTASEIAARSAWEWAQRVKMELPQGRAVICKDTEPKDADGLYQWNCNDSGTMMVAKFDWVAKTGASGTGDDNLNAKDANNIVRPKLVVTLFGNQTDFVAP